MPTLSLPFRKLAWFIPVVTTIVTACSDQGESGGTSRPSGSSTGSGTGTTASGGPSGSGTTSGAGGGATSGGNPSTGTSSGAGGSVVGAGGAASKDAGTIIVTDDGGKFGDTVCGAGVTPAGIGRCANAPKYIVAKGTALTIANFEDLGPNNDHNTIFFGDGRAGNFIDLHELTTGTFAMAIAQTAGVTGAPSWALHYSGTYTSGPMPMFSIPVADCYDSRAYKGVSFYVKGNAAAGNDHLKFQVHTPVAQPAPSGGCSAADEAAHKCDDHFGAYVTITPNWTRYNIRWSDLRQNCPSNIPVGYTPAQYNEMFSFAIPKPNAGFDVWLDNFSFDVGDLDQTTNTFQDIISEATFNEMWSLANADGTFTNLRNPFYTYQGMMTAIGGFAGIATTGDAMTRRLEAAALFSNIAHETDQLGIVEETACAGGMVQTALCQSYGVAPNGLTYHGRGPIQLTLGANYTAARSALGLSGAQDIVQHPEVVNMDPAISWRTGFWFWMGGLSGGGTTPHQAITGGQGLGATIRIINGIECNNGNPGAVQNRIRHFKRFSYMFGLDPGDLNNGC